MIISRSCQLSDVVGAMNDSKMPFLMVFPWLESIGKIRTFPELVKSFETLANYKPTLQRYSNFNYAYQIIACSIINRVTMFVILIVLKH